MKKYLSAIVIIVCFLLTALTILKGVEPVKYDLTVGEASPSDIYAFRTVVDQITTDKQREEAASSVQYQYELDNSVNQRADRDLANLFIEISEDRAGLGGGYTSSYCMSLTDAQFQNFRNIVTSVQQDIMNRGVTSKTDALNEASEILKENLGDEAAAVAGVEILKKTIAVNKEFSSDKTDEEILRARVAVPDVTYKQNQIVVRKGEIITEAQYAVLSDLGLIRGKNDTRVVQIIGAMLLSALCFVLAGIYLMRSRNKNLAKTNSRLLASIIFTFTVQTAYLNIYGGVNNYMVPVTLCAILISVLLNVKFAIFMNALAGITMAIAMGSNAFYCAAVIISGTAGAFLFNKITMRRNLVYSSLLFCLSTGAVIFAMGLLEGIAMFETLGNVLWGATGALITSVFVLGTLPFWETVFDIITPFRLVELTNPNQPLLKRLLVEAPGTYHHSLMVGNLAEAACEVVGGNELLARAGAYYHDIGKLYNPDMFYENQYGRNPHDDFLPAESVKIITVHTKEGVKLAAQYKLPGAIRNIIHSHHGNSKVSYFYRRAQEEGLDLSEDRYRYNSPHPRTKEEAVVMLADSVEAAVRSLDDKDEENIRDMVEKVVKDKINDNQLADADLTLAEITQIKDTFIKVFEGYFHTRIKYPDEKDVKDENTDNEQTKED